MDYKRGENGTGQLFFLTASSLNDAVLEMNLLS